MPATVFDRAEALAARHSPALGTRPLDVLHVASALELGASRFLTYDQRQGALARAAGLAVRPTRLTYQQPPPATLQKPHPAVECTKSCVAPPRRA